MLRQTRVKFKLETSQELGAEVGVVLGGVTVVAKVVARAVDADKVAKTTETKGIVCPELYNRRMGTAHVQAERICEKA